MSIGIHAEYQKCDATLLMLRVASHFRTLGHSVDYLPFGTADRVDPEWDELPISNLQTTYYSWIKNRFDYLFWSSPPAVECLKASRAAGTSNVLVVEWDGVDKSFIASYKFFDALICPCWEAAAFMADKLKLKNVHYVPWDAGLPVTMAPPPAGKAPVKLFWSLWGSQAERQSPEVFDMFDAALDACPEARLTVAFSKSCLSRHFNARLDKMATQHQGRMVVVRDGTLGQQLALIPSHDLVVWPTLIESSGLCGLQALSMGVPVIAFDYPVCSEFLADNRNALLVPCELRHSAIGVPYVDATEYPIFQGHLVKAVQNPKLLTRLRAYTSAGLDDRREKFAKGWDWAV